MFLWFNAKCLAYFKILLVVMCWSVFNCLLVSLFLHWAVLTYILPPQVRKTTPVIPPISTKNSSNILSLTWTCWCRAGRGGAGQIALCLPAEASPGSIPGDKMVQDRTGQDRTGQDRQYSRRHSILLNPGLKVLKHTAWHGVYLPLRDFPEFSLSFITTEWENICRPGMVELMQRPRASEVQPEFQ